MAQINQRFTAIDYFTVLHPNSADFKRKWVKQELPLHAHILEVDGSLEFYNDASKSQTDYDFLKEKFLSNISQITVKYEEFRAGTWQEIVSFSVDLNAEYDDNRKIVKCKVMQSEDIHRNIINNYEKDVNIIDIAPQVVCLSPLGIEIETYEIASLQTKKLTRIVPEATYPVEVQYTCFTADPDEQTNEPSYVTPLPAEEEGKGYILMHNEFRCNYYLLTSPDQWQHTSISTYFREVFWSKRINGVKVAMPTASGWIDAEVSEARQDGTYDKFYRVPLNGNYSPNFKSFGCGANNGEPLFYYRDYIGLGEFVKSFQIDPLAAGMSATYKRCRTIHDVIAKLVGEMDSNITVETDPNSPNAYSQLFLADTNPVTGENPNPLKDWLISDMGDILNPDAATPTTVSKLNFKELMDWLWNRFKLVWKVELNGSLYFKLDYLAYFEPSGSEFWLDMTTKRLGQRTNKYTVDNSEKPKEIQRKENAQLPDFVGQNITFAYQTDVIEEIANDRFNVDITGIQVYPEKYSTGTKAALTAKDITQTLFSYILNDYPPEGNYWERHKSTPTTFAPNKLYFVDSNGGFVIYNDTDWADCRTNVVGDFVAGEKIIVNFDISQSPAKTELRYSYQKLDGTEQLFFLAYLGVGSGEITLTMPEDALNLRFVISAINAGTLNVGAMTITANRKQTIKSIGRITNTSVQNAAFSLANADYFYNNIEMPFNSATINGVSTNVAPVRDVEQTTLYLQDLFLPDIDFSKFVKTNMPFESGLGTIKEIRQTGASNQTEIDLVYKKV